ncbi:MAG: POTRA domain-containing protein [Bacteroidota bacterium]
MVRNIILTSFIFFTSACVFSQVRFGGNFSSQPKPVTELNYAQPTEYEIEKIEVRGSEFLDENALISLSGLKVGDRIRIPGDDITNAIRKLWKQGIIGDVSISITSINVGKVSLAIDLKERPRLSKIYFDGVNRTQSSDLSDEVDLIRGRVLTDAIIKNTELAVKKYFTEKGFLNADVQVQQTKDTVLSNSVQLKITVDKKSKIKINRIRFFGNEAFTDVKLRKKLKSTGEKPRFGVFREAFNGLVGLAKKSNRQELAEWDRDVSGTDIKKFLNKNVKLNIFKSSKFDRTGYKEDKANLIAFYNSKGYRDAEIVNDTIFDHDRKTINIDITVDEGKKYYFRDIIWSGNFVHSDSTLSKILGIKQGDVYDLESLDKRLNFNPTGADVSSLYLDNGYLGFNIQPIEVRIDEDSIDVEMRIFEGGIYTINNVIITGNDRTSDHVIRREIRTLPGEKFNRSLLIRTNRELAQLGYFNPETIGINPVPNPTDNTVDIEYALEEKPSDQIELSGGFGGQLGFVGTVGLVFNNFSIRNIPNFDNWRPLPVGDGQKLAVRVQANGRVFQNYSLSFSEPWLGGKKPNNFSVNLSRSVNRTRNIDFSTGIALGPDGQPTLDAEGNPIQLRGNEFNGSLSLTSVTVGLGRRIRWPDDFFTLSNSVSYTRYRLDNFANANNSVGFTTGTANSVVFNTTLARNNIDQPLYPRSGSSIALSLSLTPPYSLFTDRDFSQVSNSERFEFIEYHKWTFDAKYYLNLVGKLVLESRAHLGFIGSYGSSIGSSPFERFILGGSGLAGQNNFLLGTDIVSLRGYDDNSISPRETLVDPVTGNQNFINGGVAFSKFVAELRYPISLNPSATIYVHAFAEGGNTWNDFGQFNPRSVFKSVGFGARIFMPAFGLIGIDWGQALDTTIDGITPNQQVFQFTIGQQLR